MRAQRALLAFGALVASVVALHSAAGAATASATSGAHFVLSLDSSEAQLERFDLAVVPTPTNANAQQITLSTGATMPSALRQWITGALQHDHARKDGAIHTVAYDGRIVSTLSFHQGLISEIDFPALESASKDAAKITLKVSPDSTTTQQGSGKLTLPTQTQAEKAWLASNFRLTVDGIDASHVQKVDAIVVKLPSTAASEPVKLVVYTPQGQAPAFSVWARDGKAKNGHLDYLAPNLREKLLGLRLGGMNVVSVANTTLSGSTVQWTKVEMTVRDVGLEP